MTSSSSSSASLTSLSDVVSNNDVVDENDVTGNDDINKTDDYKALVDCMENALELGDDDFPSMFGDSVVGTDATISNTNALSIRQEKIQKLRQ